MCSLDDIFTKIYVFDKHWPKPASVLDVNLTGLSSSEVKHILEINPKSVWRNFGADNPLLYDVKYLNISKRHIQKL